MKMDVFMCVPGLPFDGDTIYTGSLGGSETAGYYMARELARLGHRVTVFSNTSKESSHEGVRYLPLDTFHHASRVVPHDVCIIQRAPAMFSVPKASKLNVLWQHDLALKREESTFRGSMWNIDMVMLLSQFHADQYKEVYNIDKPWVHVTRNGIDLSMFDSVRDVPRNPKRVFYAARPERGLDNLLLRVMPKLVQADRDITLAVAGYNNKVDHLAPFYEMCDMVMGQSGGSCVHVGALSKAQLYQELAASSLYLYPTPSKINENFAEISCILAMEAQAAGTPIITSAKGALPETVKGGILIPGEPLSDEYVDNFVAQTLDLLNNKQRWADLSARGREHAATLDWSGVAQEWADEFERRIKANNKDDARLAMHFVRESDVDALRHLRENGTFKDPEFGAQLGQYVDEMYKFTKDDESFAAHYAAGGVDTDTALSTRSIDEYADKFRHNDEPRFAYIEEYLRGIGAKRVLDYGCGHGWMPIVMHNKLGIDVTGVDVDPLAVKWCRTFADKFGADPTKLNFSTSLPPEPRTDDERYDCLIISEVLEHVREPYKLMEHLERYIKIGGHVLFTVPYGPAEFATPHWTYFRNHIREWDLHDLHEIFGTRQNFAVGAVYSHLNDATNDPVGCWVGVYEIMGQEQPLGRPDMKRKMWLQRPRESVSLNVMAGPGSGDTIRWMLDSVRDYVDEIVIADTGMTQLDRAACTGYAIKFVEAPDPKQEGFETPRNIGLSHCTMDWVLWLDTDEKMIDAKNIVKYLRHSCFNGYGIRQHHFAVDTTFSPDMPVRLFRRVPDDGKPLRWIGMIHEHPEKGVNEGPGEVIVVSDINIAHTGYLAESGRRMRFMRNLPLLMKDVEKYPERVLQKHFLMRDKVQMALHTLQGNGGQVTQQVAAWCQEVIDLYREHFLGKNVYMAIDSLQWYSEALRILNKGFEVSVKLDASKDPKAIDANPPRVSRYASKDDLVADLMSRVNIVVDPLEHRYL